MKSNPQKKRAERLVMVGVIFGLLLLVGFILVESGAAESAAQLLGFFPGGLQEASTTSTPANKATAFAIAETAIYETQDAAPKTPLPETLWTWTPDVRPTRTPNFSSYLHRGTGSGAILWELDLMFLSQCSEDGERPFIFNNRWLQLDGPYFPFRSIYAGAYDDGSVQQGALFEYVVGETAACDPTIHLAPAVSGLLEILDEMDHKLLLRSEAGGQHFWFDVDAGAFELAGPTATPSPTATPEGGPRPAGSLSDYVLFALERIDLRSMVRIDNGNLGVNAGPDGKRTAEIEVGTFASLGEDVTLAADTVAIRYGARVPGLVFANDLTAHRLAQVSGEFISPVDLPLLPVPLIPEFTPGPADAEFVVPPGEEILLFPGEGGTIRVRHGGHLQLAAGVLDIHELILETNAVLECLGPCEIRVLDSVVLGVGAELRVDPRLELSGLVVYVARQGGVGFQTQQGSRVQGVVIAPGSEIVLGVAGSYSGTFIGNRIIVKTRAIVGQSLP